MHKSGFMTVLKNYRHLGSLDGFAFAFKRALCLTRWGLALALTSLSTESALSLVALALLDRAARARVCARSSSCARAPAARR